MSRPFYKIPGKLVASICELNQWALDFEGNYQRICQSILLSKEKGATYRMGPELEITGYNCQDHFNEIDTVIHGYEVLAAILSNREFDGIVLDIGLPVIHDGVRYNSRAICYNGELLCIRPKTVLANDGMYHEERWFVGWKKLGLGEWIVPPVITEVIGKLIVPIGVCVLQFKDVSIGIESCEELFVPNSIHNLLSMNGAHVICNGSGSHFQLGKINKRFSLVSDASGKTGCTYLYGNLQGCDGSTMYFDGGSFVASYGKIVKMCPRFSINSGVKVLIAVIDINEIRARRAAVVSLCKAAAEATILPKVYIAQSICRDFWHHYDDNTSMDPYDVINQNNREIDELIGPPSCYMWDYLRRSGSSGYFVPLSGGADSACVAILVYHMAEKIVTALAAANGNEKQSIFEELCKITKDKSFFPKSAKELVSRILFTAYMPSGNSSENSKRRSAELAHFLNSNHLSVDIAKLCECILSPVSEAIGIDPKFVSQGGSKQEDMALQNIQSRSRMVMSYVISQLAPLKGVGATNTRPLLVLGTSNADEVVRGYFTKYDCSSGDISPIASLSKEHIFRIIKHFADKYNLDILYEIGNATPTAELVPTQGGVVVQSDEQDMGLSYREICRMREIRSHLYCGPLSMFNILLDEWGNFCRTNTDRSAMAHELIAEKVKKFFIFYSTNRHKVTILPPIIHMSDNALDGRHFDLRPFLLNCAWTWQFACINSWIERRIEIKQNPTALKQ